MCINECKGDKSLTEGLNLTALYQLKHVLCVSSLKIGKKKKRHKPAKFFSVSCFALLNNVDEVVCEDEWNTLPLDAELRLEVAQDVTEIYVEKLTEHKAVSYRRGKDSKGCSLLYYTQRPL